MKEIADESIVEKFGISIRLVKESGTYLVMHAPVDQEGNYNENDFEVFGKTVGYDTSEFDDEMSAQQFFNDIQILSDEQLAERYPKIWVF